MPSVKNRNVNKETKTLGKILKTFRDTISEIIGESEVKKRSTEFAVSIADGALKLAQSKTKAEEVRAKVRSPEESSPILGNNLETRIRKQSK
jgi:hypothetical protein